MSAFDEAESLQHKDPSRALALVDAHLEGAPDDAQALNLAGFLRTTLNVSGTEAFDRGLAQLHRALTLGTDDARVGGNLANALVSAKRPAEGLAPLRTWAEAHPSHGDGWLNLGWLLAEAKHPGDALEAFDRGVHLAPLNANLRLARARVLLSQQRLDDAHTDLLEAIRGDCFRKHEAALRLGELAAARGHLRRALGFFRRAMELDSRGEFSLPLNQACQTLSAVLLQQRRFFLSAREDSWRTQRLERDVPFPVRPLDELNRDARALLQRVPQLSDVCEGLVLCATRAQLLPEYADLSFTQRLEPHGDEGRSLARRWAGAVLELYDELLSKEEPLPGRCTFEVALAARDWPAALRAVEAEPVERRAALAERLSARLRLLGREEDARRSISLAISAAEQVASWATSGGEGLAGVAEVQRLKALLDS